MSILRQRRRRPGYTTLDNDLLCDRRLSWAARGMLAFLLSKPDGWDVREGPLSRESSAPRTGIDAVQAILAELEAAGYVRRGWENSARGHRQRVTEVSDVPSLTGSGFSADGETTSGETTAIESTDLSNYPEDKEDIGLPPSDVRHPQLEATAPRAARRAAIRAGAKGKPVMEGEKERASTVYGDLFVAVRSECGYGAQPVVGKVAQQVSIAAKDLVKINATPAEVALVGAAFARDDFRGQRGDAPTPSQLVEWVIKLRAQAEKREAMASGEGLTDEEREAAADRVNRAFSETGVVSWW